MRLQYAPPTETGTELHAAAYNPIRKRQSLNSSAIVLIVLLASLCSIQRVVEVLLLRSLESGRIFGKCKMPQKEVLEKRMWRRVVGLKTSLVFISSATYKRFGSSKIRVFDPFILLNLSFPFLLNSSRLNEHECIRSPPNLLLFNLDRLELLPHLSRWNYPELLHYLD